MSSNKGIFICALITCSFSCKSPKSNIKTSNGYELFFHEIAQSEKIIPEHKILNLKISAFANNENLVFSSKYQGISNVSSFYYDSAISNSPMKEILYNLYVGDSVSFNMSSKIFYKSFFGEKFHLLDHNKERSLKIILKVLSYNNLDTQDFYLDSLQKLAINNEKKLLSKEKEFWDNNFLNIFKIKGIYAMKLASKESFNTDLDSLPDKIGLCYSISDLKGREIYRSFNNTPEYYESNIEGQLLDGFKILVNNFQKGDSIHAIIPSKLMFGQEGSFVSKIPAYCPLKIHLRLH